MITNLAPKTVTAVLFAFAAASAAPALGASDITFGKTPTYQTDDKFELAVSDDKKAFTLTFSDFQVEVGNTKQSPQMIASRVFSLALPAGGKDKYVDVTFNVSGAIVPGTGESGNTSGSIMLSVNGQTSIANFTAKSDKGFVHPLTYKTTGADSEFRITIFVLLDRDSKFPDAAAIVSVEALDGNIKVK